MKDAKRLARNLTILYAVALAVTHSVAFLIFAGFVFALAAFAGFNVLKRGGRLLRSRRSPVIELLTHQRSRRQLAHARSVSRGTGQAEFDFEEAFATCPSCNSRNTEPYGNTAMHCLDC